MNRAEQEAKKRQYANTPQGRVDLQGGRTLDKSEWIEELNRHDHLEQRERRQKAFNAPETPLEGLILFREQRTYYLLNRSGRSINRLTYEATAVDDMGRVLAKPKQYRLQGIPPKTYVALQRAAPEAQRKTTFTLTSVDWTRFDAWSGRRTLHCQSPMTVVQELQQLPLTQAAISPTRVAE
jgi:hypothetical protein